jgi:hypothetical protein
MEDHNKEHKERCPYCGNILDKKTNSFSTENNIKLNKLLDEHDKALRVLRTEFFSGYSEFTQENNDYSI